VFFLPRIWLSLASIWDPVNTISVTWNFATGCKDIVREDLFLLDFRVFAKLLIKVPREFAIERLRRLRVDIEKGSQRVSALGNNCREFLEMESTFGDAVGLEEFVDVLVLLVVRPEQEWKPFLGPGETQNEAFMFMWRPTANVLLDEVCGESGRGGRLALAREDPIWLLGEGGTRKMKKR
jgi:hypothetical protein